MEANLNEEFFPPPDEPAWVDKMRSKKLRELIKTAFQPISQDINFTVAQLPTKMEFIEPSTVDTTHIVRYVSPWDFHLIVDSAVDYLLVNPEWKSIFQLENETGKNFKTPAQLFRGLTMLISFYVKYLRTLGKDKPNKLRVDYNPGDLVVAVVPRNPKRSVSTFSPHFGYRGVIVQSLDVVKSSLKIVRRCFLVYLLDTGEQWILSNKFLRPFHPHFIVFPPMAIKCALHGVSPIGPEWTNSAKKAVQELFAGKADKRIFAEFYSRKPEDFLQLTLSLDYFLTKEPYFVELFMSPRYGSWTHGEDVINLSEVLVSKTLALEWTLLPQRPALRLPVTVNPNQTGGDPTKINWCTKSTDCLVWRDEALLLCEPCPVPIKSLSDEELELEITRIMHLKRAQMRSSYMTGMKNIMALIISDPKHILRQPCGPPIFYENRNTI